MKFLTTVFLTTSLLLSGHAMASTNNADIETVRSCNLLESMTRDGITMRQNNQSFDEALDYIISNYELDYKGTAYELDSEGTVIIENLLAAIYTMPVMPPETKEMLTLMLTNTLLETCLNEENEEYNDDNIEIE
jgi:hypothetical protein